jgi:hypothetical protein
MNKVLLVLGLLLSLGLTSSCISDDENDGIVDSSEKNSEGDHDMLITPLDDFEGFAAISEFFNSELPSTTYSKGFFIDTNNNINVDKVHVGDETYKIINSKNELSKIYSGEKPLPEIDFQHYTLVVGQIIMPAIGYQCVKQEISYTQKDNNAVLNLYVENIYELNPCMIVPLYFWGLYPKTHLSNIKVNITML